MNKLFAAAGLAAIALAFAGPAAATDVASGFQGWVNSNGTGNGAFNGNNTFTGNENTRRYNSWASFDIPVGVYTDASLLMTLAPFGNATGDEIGIFDSNASEGDLAAESGGVGAYNDFMTGSQYGSIVYVDNLPHLVHLGGNILADVNAAAGGTLIIGFTNLTLNGQPSGNNQDDGLYTNGNSVNQPVLQLQSGAVPEPAAWTLMIGGFGLAGAALRRRKATAAA